jgi:hypothetical protein
VAWYDLLQVTHSFLTYIFIIYTNTAICETVSTVAHFSNLFQMKNEALLYAVVLDTCGTFAMLTCYERLQACLAYDRQSGAELDLMLIGDWRLWMRRYSFI